MGSTPGQEDISTLQGKHCLKVLFRAALLYIVMIDFVLNQSRKCNYGFRGASQTPQVSGAELLTMKRCLRVNPLNRSAVLSSPCTLHIPPHSPRQPTLLFSLSVKLNSS